MAKDNSYFQSYNDYFWQWEEDGEVVAIPGAATIAYGKQLGEIISHLHPQGLPPLGALLLALIATNPDGRTSLDDVNKIGTTLFTNTKENRLSGALEFLKLLTEVPPSFKQGRKRLYLLQVIFERCHRTLSLKDSARIHSQYQAGIRRDDPVLAKKNISEWYLDSDFRTIALLYNKFKTVNDIIDRIAGLPDSEQIEINFEEVPATQDTPPTNDLVKELTLHHKTFAVGSLVRWLWSGLNIPVHSALPSQQPLGGVSDLTNKGNYDKLLISEFANDDMVFLSRLANQEALYLQRETPPANNNLHRVVLIDATLKNWGTPKTVAFAVAIAVARHPKTDIACTAYVVDDTTYHPISIDNTESIINALQIVKGGLHAGPGLEAFFKDMGKDKDREMFFITEPTTLRQATLLRVLNEHQQQIHYHIYTDAEGNIDVYKKHGTNKKHLQHLRLPLDTLWKKPDAAKRAEPLHVKFQADYPILLHGSMNDKKVVMSEQGEIFMITKEKSLLRLFDKHHPAARGWDLVYTNLPFIPDFCEVGLTDNNQYILLMFNRTAREIALLNLQTGDKHKFIFTPWKSARPYFVFDGKQFIYQVDNEKWSISIRGEVERTTQDHHDNYQDRSSKIQKVASQLPATNRFKNINTIFINTQHEIVFNNQALRLTPDGTHVRLIANGDSEIKITAQRNNDQTFHFYGGSVVEINHNGFAILRSSDRLIPTIYIPTTLKGYIALATAKEFTGNQYYYKESICEVSLNATKAHSKLTAIKVLKQWIDLPLREAKDFVEQPSHIKLPIRFPKSKAEAFREDMEKVGVHITIHLPENSNDIQQITPDAFFNKHIKRFINTVLNHGD